ncbi:MAG: 3-phosphoshikimate 1-carboxyvinyltransferase [Bacteroides sp.]|jgi:3-phosphoshikimate 1-carboxyvinyltransferase|nr:3-phosphoshikimate 1-carboxyvinyltransferase [Bacteroides sp.]MCI1681152.1 3-phosphoshikimate 1-carboxyvinyltransferase [Bacteroides sp.]
MCYKITAPEVLQLSLRLPASKSISNRALILHALSKGNIIPSNLSDCDDTRVMTKALQTNSNYIDIMAAGTAMRFLTAYFSVTPGTKTITGTERMRQRPIGILVDALRSLGAKIEYLENEGYPPLRITGSKLTGDSVELEGNVSSQYISALLMIGPTLENGLTLHLSGEIISRPYINLTIQLMKEFGGEAEWASEDTLLVRPGNYKDIPFTVESDWSAASYWYEMLALSPRRSVVELTGLFRNSYQGDSQCAKMFTKLGVETEYTDDGIRLTKTENIERSLELDFIETPDLAQTFVVTCALLGIDFRFTGLQSLKIKETDRIEALINELKTIGFVIRVKEDSILIGDRRRCKTRKRPVVKTYEDHRMAMAFAPAAFRIPEIRIADPMVVSKSYPRYWEDLEAAKFIIEKV